MLLWIRCLALSDSMDQPIMFEEDSDRPKVWQEKAAQRSVVSF
jgi:hypothetical protein